MEGASGCDVIEFTRKLKAGHEYRLELYIQLNRTILNLFKENSYAELGWTNDEETLLNVKGVMNGVNPDNVVDKIKNLLLFL